MTFVDPKTLGKTHYSGRLFGDDSRWTRGGLADLYIAATLSNGI